MINRQLNYTLFRADQAFVIAHVQKMTRLINKPSRHMALTLHECLLDPHQVLAELPQ